MNKLMTLGSLLSILPALPAWSVEATVNGFGTLGYAISDTNKAMFKRAISRDTDRGYLTDTLVGLQVDTHLTSRLDLTGQVLVAQDLDQRAHLGVRSEWLFLGYRLTEQTRVRAGKLRLPAYMLSERLEVGHSYPWVRPPIEVYGQLVNNSFNGIDLLYRAELGNSELLIQPFLGNGEFNVFDLDQHHPNQAFRTELNNIAGINLNLNPNDDLKLRLSYFTADVRGSGTPEHQTVLSPELTVNTYDWLYGSGLGNQPNDLSRVLHFSGSFSSVGIQYKMGSTQVMAELAKRDIQTAIYEDALGGYAGISHKIGAWTPFIYYAEASGKAQMSQQKQLPVGSIAPLKLQQHTWAMGINYDLSATSKLKFQVENTVISERRAMQNGYIPLPIGSTTSLHGLDIMMYSLAYDFLF
jgi:hypothetical protein